MQQLPVNAFLAAEGPILDVRSPVEFNKGRIPGAHNMPLFSDDERAIVGTLYRKEGQAAAYQKGLELVTPRLHSFIAFAEEKAPNRILRLHCWRGGLRSQKMAEHLEQAGFSVALLEGGYKAYRHAVLNELEKNRDLLLVGGLTGVGKTLILKELSLIDLQVLDLEERAQHRGSSFGMIGMPRQPSQEHFDNRLAEALFLSNRSKPLWLEDESRYIGSCQLPKALFEQMQKSPLFLVERSLEERIDILEDEYLKFYDPDLFIAAVERIAQRLGGLRTKEVISCFRSDRIREAVALILDYYDRAYRRHLAFRVGPVTVINATGLSSANCAKVLMEEASQRHGRESVH